MKLWSTLPEETKDYWRHWLILDLPFRYLTLKLQRAGRMKTAPQWLRRFTMDHALDGFGDPLQCKRKRLETDRRYLKRLKMKSWALGINYQPAIESFFAAREVKNMRDKADNKMGKVYDTKNGKPKPVTPKETEGSKHGGSSS